VGMCCKGGDGWVKRSVECGVEGAGPEGGLGELGKRLWRETVGVLGTWIEWGMPWMVLGG